MGDDTIPLLRRASTSLTLLSTRFHSIATPRLLTSKAFISICIIALTFPILFWHRDTIKDLSVPFPRPFARPISQFIAEGDSRCLPLTTPEMIAESLSKHASCRKFSPFITGRSRIATVTAHFGSVVESYQDAFRTHLLHSLIHGTEVRVMCDPIIDDLWNKPAFILNLLMREMLKPAKERLEWIMWVDRDTMILDQCRPISSFLPPEDPRSWWGGNQAKPEHDTSNRTEVNLLTTSDWNGLNNGVFILRVNQWAISLFTAILAFRHYNPSVNLPFTEQSAMEHVMQTEPFRHQTQTVPQHWFNAYDHGGAMMFALRENVHELSEEKARRGDFLVHFAGQGNKAKLIGEYKKMLQGLPNVWQEGSTQRDSDKDIADFWKNLGY